MVKLSLAILALATAASAVGVNPRGDHEGGGYAHPTGGYGQPPPPSSAPPHPPPSESPHPPSWTCKDDSGAWCECTETSPPPSSTTPPPPPSTTKPHPYVS